MRFTSQQYTDNKYVIAKKCTLNLEWLTVNAQCANFSIHNIRRARRHILTRRKQFLKSGFLQLSSIILKMTKKYTYTLKTYYH